MLDLSNKSIWGKSSYTTFGNRSPFKRTWKVIEWTFLSSTFKADQSHLQLKMWLQYMLAGTYFRWGVPHNNVHTFVHAATQGNNASGAQRFCWQKSKQLCLSVIALLQHIQNIIIGTNTVEVCILLCSPWKNTVTSRSRLKTVKAKESLH